MKHNLLSIIPPPQDELGGIQCWTGTRVVDGFGNEVDGVTKVEIVIERDMIAAAVLHCAIVPVSISGIERIDYDGYEVVNPVSWWRRALMRAAGFCYDESGLKMTSIKKRI